MATTSPSTVLAPSIRSALAGLRRRIRVYIWLEALSLVVIWLGLTFWLALALDYFPVLVWASEMPRAARGVLLAIIAGGLGWLLFRYLLQRVFVPISDRSLAVLLERKFDAFHDSLVTAVELAGGSSASSGLNAQMLAHTHQDAGALVDEVAISRVFNYRPLQRKIALAIFVAATILLFLAFNASAAQLAGERLYLLADTPWPRSAEIEVVGIEIQHAPASEGRAATTQELSFNDHRMLKVGRGANVAVRVRAASHKRIPDYCTIYYRTADGDRGNVQMKKVGRLKDGYQQYVFEGKPFQGLLADLRFDVMGYDHRLRDFHLEVVDSPALIGTEVACQFPDYMVDEALSQWLPRTETLTAATQLPLGTELTVHCRANKPLRQITIYDPQSEQTTTLEVSEESESFTLPPMTLASSVALELTLLDTDGVRSDRPQRLYIPAVRDEAPRVSVKLAGISSLVTPDVALPVTGSIEDDYGIAKSWFDLQINDQPPQQLPFTTARDGTLNHAFDFRELRSQDSRWQLRPTDKLTLVVVGQDKHALAGGPQSGFGDRWELQVVTPDELLASLEARELGLRRRFEQVITELTDTRDELLRAAAEPAPPASDNAPQTDANGKIKTEEGLSVSLRTLIAQRALQQSQKSAQELLGIAGSFADIRTELINNRVDTEERKARLKEQIADPLSQIVQQRFPSFDGRLKALEATPNDAQVAQLAIDEATELLLDLDTVLQRMLDLETYNELVELVRSLIQEQEQLQSETKKQQAAELLK